MKSIKTRSKLEMVVIMLMKIVVMLLMSLSINCFAHESLLFRQLNQCKNIKNRLDRLSCFDEVVGTPIEKKQIKQQKFPNNWYQFYSIMNKAKDSYHLYIDKNSQHNAWIGIKSQSLTIEGNNPQYSLLILSCINNLSRVEVVFPFKINAHNLWLNLPPLPNQILRSDDMGVIFSAARGLFAIEAMKSMARKNQVQINLNEKNISYIQFDVTKLTDFLPNLKQRCHW